MKILAFDTSSSACSVALLNGDKTKILHKISPMQQAKLILSMIDEALASTSLTLDQLDAIAYGCGPGSFTGVRIAASVAQGLSFGRSLPILSISSLAAMAQAAFLERQWTRLLVAVDARTEQLYWSKYVVNAAGIAILEGEEQACLPEQIKAPEDEINWYGIGDGWAKYEEKLVMSLKFKPETLYCQLPTAAALLPLAKAKFDQKDWILPSNAIPVYLR